MNIIDVLKLYYPELKPELISQNLNFLVKQVALKIFLDYQFTHYYSDFVREILIEFEKTGKVNITKTCEEK